MLNATSSEPGPPPRKVTFREPEKQKQTQSYITWSLHFFVLDSRRVLVGTPAPLCCAMLITIICDGLALHNFIESFVALEQIKVAQRTGRRPAAAVAVEQRVVREDVQVATLHGAGVHTAHAHVRLVQRGRWPVTKTHRSHPLLHRVRAEHVLGPRGWQHRHRASTPPS